MSTAIQCMLSRASRRVVGRRPRRSVVSECIRANPYLLPLLPIAPPATDSLRLPRAEDAREESGDLGNAVFIRDMEMMNLNHARSVSTRRYHAVRFYDNAKSLSQIVAAFLSEGFAAGQPGIVVATPIHRAAILRELVAADVDVVDVQRSGDLVLLDAEDTLSAFMADGIPNPEKFTSSMCEVIKRACQGRGDCTVRIYGEMVDVLWREGNQQAAIRLEMLWNTLANTEAFSLLCGYAMGHFYKDANFADICGHHTHVVAADGNASAVA
jgi:hypothetical protein